MVSRTNLLLGDSHQNHSRSLDEALECVVLALESNQPLDREALVAQFPQWAEDIHQFIDNWMSIEHKTEQLANVQPGIATFQSAHLPGKVIGDYELLELVSSGGMGVVYRARQASLGRIVALKMVWNAIRDKARFRVEAEAAASLHHANIVSIYEVGEIDGQPFLSMQFVEGGNLHDRLRAGPLPPAKAATLVQTLALAVHYAHQRGVLHRDLKPANVLLDTDGKPFVTDFGLAKQMGNSVELTRSGAIIGTPGYMAPEQAMGRVKSITVAVDVYGLGAILYAALTGEAPFKADSDLITLRRVIEEPPVSPRIKHAHIDRNLDTICLKCLEKTPTNRYTSAKQLADDLGRYLRGEPVMARPIGVLEQRWRWCLRNPMLAALSGLAMLLIVAVVVMSIGFGWREYLARLSSEQARARETAMRESIGLARENAESQNRATQRALGDLYTTNGLWAARMDAFGEAVLWFARAARLDGIEPSEVAASQTRCMSWLTQSPRPVAAWKMTNRLRSETFQRDWRSWAFLPERSEVMFKSGKDFGIWRFESDEIWRPSSLGWTVNAAAWSRDGELLVLGGPGGEVRILDAQTKSTQADYRLDGPITCVAFANSGRQMAVGAGTQLQLLNTTGDKPQELQWQEAAEFVSLRFSNDDAYIAAVDRDGRVKIHSVAKPAGQPIVESACYVPPESSFEQPLNPNFSDDGSKLFVRSEARRAKILATSTGKQLGPLIVTGLAFSVALSPDQVHLAVGGDTYARLQTIQWSDDVPTLRRHASRLAHQDEVSGVTFGGKNLVVTSGRDQVVQIWNIDDAEPTGVIPNERAIPLAALPHTDQVAGVLFPQGAGHMVTVQRDGLVRVWEIPDFQPPGYTTEVAQGGSTAKLVDGERWLISGTTHWRGNMVNASVRRIRDGLVMAETPLNGLSERGHLLDAAITRDQKILVSLHAHSSRSSETMLTQDDSAGSIQVWEFPGARPLGSPLKLNAEPRSVAISPDGKTAAVLSVNKVVSLVDLRQPKLIDALQPEFSEFPLDLPTGRRPSGLFNGQVQYSSDGSYLVAWGIGQGFFVWDVNSKRPLFSTRFSSTWSVRQVTLSSDSETIALATYQPYQAILVDRKNGKILKAIEHSAAISSLAFSRSGKEFLTAGSDGRVRIADAQTGDRTSIDLVHTKGLLDAIFSPDDRWLATLTNDMRVHIWRTRDGQLAMKPMQVPAGSRKLMFSEDAQHLITSGTGRRIQVMDLRPFCDFAKLNLNQTAALGELLSAKLIGEGGIVNMTSAQWMERWQAYRTTQSSQLSGAGR